MQTQRDVISLRSAVRKMLFAGCFASFATACDAATVGRWRFENSGNLGLDSGPNGLNLNLGSASSSTDVASNPIPQANSTNSRSADFELSSTNYLAIGDQPEFAIQSFTIEAYIRLESLGTGSTGRVIASQMNTGTGASIGWQFGITGSGSGLGGSRPFLQLSSDGLAIYGFSPEPSTAPSSFTVTTDVYYYVAATVDFSGGAVATKFYLQNLTTPGSLISMDGTPTLPSAGAPLPTSLHNSTANFAIGISYADGALGSSRRFDGLIDEVKLSDTVLTQDQLLAVPEPTSMVMVGVGVLAAGVVRRRR